ncbi:hypothetical protein BDK51DRAFT_34838 [Blyttiomyces helicus]|uniref:Uncharacterized protein n=1 Tax=Blyttiomyces helicus TaxID=388810 RepID=A0A4P9W592_9FUNG|nr:hypothetical protein BDK51DRAFT_34838 [Blyttiomyces helicus]|eukprot:RKO87559.1 hypothetical protein BDK51DRAFT_34838 [Blyttiomyces helicus]
MALADNLRSAHPMQGFRRFVAKLLARTQVSLSVVLLALKFILRASDAVASAEVLPLPIAFLAGLRLANKFTDDNWFSNLAWADAGNRQAQPRRARLASHARI